MCNGNYVALIPVRLSMSTLTNSTADKDIFYLSGKNIKNEARFREEIALMKRMDHPNIIRLFETFEDHKNIYLILELCTGGELFDTIVKNGMRLLTHLRSDNPQILLIRTSDRGITIVLLA